jgi:hypothetical protein
MRVETARGAMAVDGLGTTLLHEHVFVLTPDVKWILRAVWQTHVETGTPITVHTSAALKTGLIAQRILKEKGVDLTKVESATAVIRPTSTTYARSPTRARCPAWTVSALTCSCRSRTASPRSRRWRRPATRIGWCWRTMRPATATSIAKAGTIAHEC